MEARGQGAAVAAVRRGIVHAEEKYLVDPEATLGTWLARVQETVSVACRVTVARMAEGRSPLEGALLDEQLGLYSDICAETIRATAQAWGDSPSPQATEEIAQLLAERCRGDIALDSWHGFLMALVRCTAALEPLANGLREGDLPMGEPTDCDEVAECLLEVAQVAFGVVDALV